MVAEIERSHADVEAFECEYRLLCKDGRELTVWDCDQLVFGDDGAPTHSQGIMVDVSALRSAEAALRDTEQQLQATVSAAPLTLTALDLDGVMTLATGKGLEGLGATRAELEGHSVFDVFHDVPQVVADCRRALTGESLSSLVRIDDHDFACAYEPVFDDRGTLKSVIVVATDVTEQRRDEAQILHLAYHDQLTGLPNRARFERAARARARRRRAARGAAPRARRPRADRRRPRPRDRRGARSASSPSACGPRSPPTRCSPARTARRSSCCSSGSARTRRATPRRSSPRSRRPSAQRSRSRAPSCR